MYNKLFTKILDSSIWLEPTSTRIVWITLIAAMDQDGFAQFASVKNLAHRAVITEEDAVVAVDCLEGPDPNSADTDNEGRRIERVPGGWMVLNAPKYRELVTKALATEKTRERVTAHRSRKRSGLDYQIKQQEGKCACCQADFQTPYVTYVVQDHDHETGQPRGAICVSCNKIVGQIENNTPTISPKAETCRNYLERYSNVPVTPKKRRVTQKKPLDTPSEAEANTEAELSHCDGANAPVAAMTDHQRMMAYLRDKVGPIPDGGAQGQAIKWLLTNYTVEESCACLDSQIDFWDKGRVSWLSVKSHIGSWKLREGRPVRNGQAREVGQARVVPGKYDHVSRR